MCSCTLSSQFNTEKINAAYPLILLQFNFFLCASSMATDVPSTSLGGSLYIPDWRHPQSLTFPRCRQQVSNKICPPQSHRHSQTIYLFLRFLVGAVTVSFPVRKPAPAFRRLPGSIPTPPFNTKCSRQQLSAPAGGIRRGKIIFFSALFLTLN